MTTSTISTQNADNFDLVLASVKKNGLNLEYASTSLKNNPFIVMNALFSDPGAFVYASEELQNNKEFLLSVVSCIPYNNDQYAETLLNLIPKHFLEDFDIVDEAVQKTGSALRWVSSEFRKDKRIVLAAISSSPSAFRYADDSLKNNLAIVQVAIRLDGMNLLYLKSKSLLNDTDLIYESLYSNSAVYHSLPENLQENIVVQFIYEHANHILASDWSLVKRALQVNPDVMLNPPPPLLALLSDDYIPYAVIANYALHCDMKISMVEPFDFCE